MNIAEVYAVMRAGEEDRTEAFLSGLTVLAVTGEIGRRAGTFKAEQSRVGRTVSLADMLVAATALVGGVGLRFGRSGCLGGIG